MELTKRLAAEYDLQLVYKKAFNEILSEEQSSRDFGPLLAKMGVLNAEGASNMDEAQWEAASKHSFAPCLDAADRQICIWVSPSRKSSGSRQNQHIIYS